MSLAVRAVYHHNDATAYRIGICIKNEVRHCVVYVDFGNVGPIVAWFAVGFVMEEMFFVSV